MSQTPQLYVLGPKGSLLRCPPVTCSAAAAESADWVVTDGGRTLSWLPGRDPSITHKANCIQQSEHPRSLSKSSTTDLQRTTQREDNDNAIAKKGKEAPDCEVITT